MDSGLLRGAKSAARNDGIEPIMTAYMIRTSKSHHAGDKNGFRPPWQAHIRLSTESGYIGASAFTSQAGRQGTAGGRTVAIWEQRHDATDISP
jgi:hypothetical protein